MGVVSNYSIVPVATVASAPPWGWWGHEAVVIFRGDTCVVLNVATVATSWVVNVAIVDNS